MTEKSRLTKDLTRGNPFGLILGFAVPLLLGYVFQQFYTVVDTIIVGKFLGVQDLAAVGSTGAVNFLVIGFCMGLCSGFAIPVAQKFGAHDYSAMRRFVYAAALLTAAFSVALAVLTVLFCRPLMRFMRTPPDIIEHAVQYISIIFGGIPAILAYNMLAGIIRSLGDSRTPLIFLLVSSVLNIGLDLLFICVCNIGIIGAAWATVIAQGISAIVCFIFMRQRFEILRINSEEKRITKRQCIVLLSIGVPMGLQYSVTAIGSVILQSAVNSLGSAAVAAIAAAQKIGIFFCTPFDALGATMATYGGQNTGAAKLERLDSGLKCACVLGFVYAACALFVLWRFGRTFGLLFVNATEHNILDNVQLFLLVNSSCYVLLALVNIVRFMIQGMGFSAFAVFAGIFELVGRAVIGIACVPVFGFAAACFASPAAWVLADAFLIPAYFICRKRLSMHQYCR